MGSIAPPAFLTPVMPAAKMSPIGIQESCGRVYRSFGGRSKCGWYLLGTVRFSWNAVGKFQGHSPVKLNEHGISQAKRVAKAIGPMRPLALYSSPLPRALMTAKEISRAVALPIMPLDEIMEANLGRA